AAGLEDLLDHHVGGALAGARAVGVAAEVVHHDPGPAAGEQQGVAAAQPRPCPGDDRDLVVEANVACRHLGSRRPSRTSTAGSYGWSTKTVKPAYAAPMPPAVAYDPLAPEVIADPYPWYRSLRDDAPVHYEAGRDVWVISRYDDVLAAARAHEALSSREGIT